jgi:hypothetical protein
MVWVPFATAIEFHVKLFDDDDAIRLPSTRKATRLTLRLILTVVVTKLATVESGVGEAIFIGLAAYARLCPSSKRSRPTIPTLVSLNRLPPARLAISPPAPAPQPPGKKRGIRLKKSSDGCTAGRTDISESDRIPRGISAFDRPTRVQRVRDGAYSAAPARTR